jgi:hypothetical protein
MKLLLVINNPWFHSCIYGQRLAMNPIVIVLAIGVVDGTTLNNLK